ncbi:MAG: type II toxin-antitoxin system VapC family toxin [Pseudomonadota bacterium]|nr:type II toxin-antitoxin system VapC family toxin [Pseudomonadota bacterium]
MKVLLDTQALLWFLLDDPRLSRKALDCIADPDNDILISPASHWEIAIKISIGKYKLTEDFEAFFSREIRNNGFLVLPIEIRHTAALSKLPFHHRDPFDRLIIAQSQAEGILLISSDTLFDHYGVRRLW